MLDSGLLADLRAIVGDEAVLTGARVRECATDVQGHAPAAPALVRPHTTSEVSAILKLCHVR